MERVKILVADDERLERSILCKKLLREFGDCCELIQAENGREAWRVFQEHHPQIAVLDVVMPGLTGIEVAAQIRGQNSHCIIVFLSAYSDFSYARQAIRLHALDYLTKPYQKEELFAVMEEAVHQAKHVFRMEESELPVLGREQVESPAEELFWNGEEPQISMGVTSKIIGFIEQNYMNEISMQDAAQFMSYSDTYFCRLFKQCFGCNFTSYLTDYRMKQAKHLLGETELSVRDVALRTGYADSNYFAKVFKRKLGVVPSEYRIEHNAQKRKRNL